MKLGLFSVSYAGFWGQHQLDLPTFIKKASSLGFESVMIAGKRPHLSPLDSSDEQLALVRAALKKSRIRCGAIAAYTDLAPPLAAEVPALEMQIAYVESLSRIARALDAPLVRVFTAYETDGLNPSTVWNGVVTALREMCDRAQAYEVTIAVQNHHDVALDSNALLELLHDVDRPNCKLGFDAWSPALRGEDLYEAAKRMAPFTAMTTNADYIRWPRFRYRPEFVNYERTMPDMVRAVPFGEGFIDYDAFFRGLQDGGFEGLATYEMCSPLRGGGELSNLDACAARYLEWMRTHNFGSPARPAVEPPALK